MSKNSIIVGYFFDFIPYNSKKEIFGVVAKNKIPKNTNKIGKNTSSRAGILIQFCKICNAKNTH